MLIIFGLTDARWMHTCIVDYVHAFPKHMRIHGRRDAQMKGILMSTFHSTEWSRTTSFQITHLAFAESISNTSLCNCFLHLITFGISFWNREKLTIFKSKDKETVKGSTFMEVYFNGSWIDPCIQKWLICVLAWEILTGYSNAPATN